MFESLALVYFIFSLFYSLFFSLYCILMSPSPCVFLLLFKRYDGNLVAIKTVIDVTDNNLRSFREEILLTASLKHPNIVNFVVLYTDIYSLACFYLCINFSMFQFCISSLICIFIPCTSFLNRVRVGHAN